MRTARLGLAVIALGVGGMLTAPAAVAQEAPCAYPFDCPIGGEDGGGGSAGGEDTSGGTGTGGTVSGGTGAAGTGSTANAAALPFTGGEVVLMSLAGAGAVAAGGALLVAGRKRSHA